jgi:hypothetical protein
VGIREIIMFGVVFAAYKTADKSVLKANEFDFGPIKEVAYLFVGIFFTMIPALRVIADLGKREQRCLYKFIVLLGNRSAFLIPRQCTHLLEFYECSDGEIWF